MKEFMYCFQISKLIVFEVEYYTLGGNKAPYFSTSAAEFIRSKRDYNRCGQAQRELLPKHSPARRFFEKWDYCHLHDLTPAEIMRERFTTGNKTPLIHWRRFSKWTQRHATGFILQLEP